MTWHLTSRNLCFTEDDDMAWKMMTWHLTLRNLYFRWKWWHGIWLCGIFILWKMMAWPLTLHKLYFAENDDVASDCGIFISRKMMTWHLTSHNLYFVGSDDVASDSKEPLFHEKWWHGIWSRGAYILRSRWRGPRSCGACISLSCWCPSPLLVSFRKSQR